MVNVIVTAFDGVNITSLPIAVTINNVNEAPTITSLAAVSVAENTTAVTTVTGVDPDGPTTFTYALAGGVDAGLFSINATTGALAFNSAPNFEAPADTGADNVYNVDVSINDGTTTVTQNMTVTVTNANDAPTGTLTINDVTPTEGSPITVSAAAIADQDGLGAFTYQWQSFNGTNWNNIAGATAASFTPQDVAWLLWRTSWFATARGRHLHGWRWFHEQRNIGSNWPDGCELECVYDVGTKLRWHRR